MAELHTQGFSIGKAIKRYLITGILVWLPITVTIWILTSIINSADRLIQLIPEQWQPEKYIGLTFPGMGVLLAIAVLFCTGIFAANVIGSKIIEGWDSLMGRIPVVKSIYSSVKKVSESLLSDNSRSFKTPVLVPFPQPNIWTIAFVSGSIPKTVSDALPEKTGYMSVYVPTTPNPTGGYYIMVRTADIRELDMTVDEALKYVISLGMVMPDELPMKKAKELLPAKIETEE